MALQVGMGLLSKATHRLFDAAYIKYCKSRRLRQMSKRQIDFKNHSRRRSPDQTVGLSNQDLLSAGCVG